MRSLLLASVVAFGVGSANAAVISGTYAVTGSDFGSAGSAPFSSITESFTITFDNTQYALEQTAGVSLNPSTITPASALAFTYVPGADTLLVGGTAAGTQTADPTSVDFALIINNASSIRNFVPVALSYSLGQGVEYPAATVGQSAATSVPEPISLITLILALGATVVVRQRRKA